jgi:zinc protease
MKMRLLSFGILLSLGLSAAAEDQRAPVNTSGDIQALQYLSSMAQASTQPSLNLPQVESFQTRSGATVLFVAAPELPIVDIRLTFDAGSARDGSIRPQLFGLASLTAQLLDEGTSTQSTDDIAARFEALGVQYSAAAYRDMFTIDLRSLATPQLLDPAIEQLLALLKDAQFPQSSIDRVFQNAAIGQRQREESPSSVANIRFWRELYGTHPYAEPSSGTQASLKQITREDLLAFKSKFLVARNLNIAITGRLTLKQAKQLAEQLTKALPKGEPAPALPDPLPTTQARLVHVPFGSSQTHVMIGQLGVKRDNPDLPTLSVGNEILGGGDFNALLMKELREKRGLTYGAYSGFSAMRSRGPFSISYSTRADQARQSIDVAKQTLAQFLQQGVSDAVVQEAKEGILNSYPLSLSSNQNINGFLAMMGFYRLPTTYLADYPKQIEQVNAAAIQRAFMQYVQPDTLLTVVVGQPLESDTSIPTTPATTP